MGKVLDAVENGEAEIVDGKSRMPKWPKFLQRMVTPPFPVMNLVRRFLRLVLRGKEAAKGGDRPQVQDEAPRLSD